MLGPSGLKALGHSMVLREYGVRVLWYSGVRVSVYVDIKAFGYSGLTVLRPYGTRVLKYWGIRVLGR